MHSDPSKLTLLAGDRIHRFHGGLRLKHNKKVSCQDPVTRPALPDILSVPMQQHFGAPARAIIGAGDQVLKGQPVGISNQGNGCIIHAPTSGTVLAVENRGMSHASGLPGLCVVIRPDGDDKWCELCPCPEWELESQEALIDRFRHAGIAGLGGRAEDARLVAAVSAGLGLVHVSAHQRGGITPLSQEFG